MAQLSEIIQWFDFRMAKGLAAAWDNTGLLLGDPAMEISRVLTCLSLTRDVAEEAINAKCNLVVTHHPLPFKPIKTISTQSYEGEILWRLASKGIAIYSPHTRWDNAEGGINETLAFKSGMFNLLPFGNLVGAKEIKVTTFVPEGNLESVATAMFQAGGGEIGNYKECSFRQNGTGTFFGQENANPVVGQKGQRELVSEVRLEMVCPVEKIPHVINALRKSHPYEEPAFDLFELQPKPLSRGEGVIGDMPPGSTLESVSSRLKTFLKSSSLAFIGKPEEEIKRAAIVCGSGGSFLSLAIRERVCLFITGEMRFHECLEARDRGLAVIVLGHYSSEKFAMEILAGELAKSFPDIQATPSGSESDPLRWVF